MSYGDFKMFIRHKAKGLPIRIKVNETISRTLKVAMIKSIPGDFIIYDPLQDRFFLQKPK
jgi:hypothetical protein